MNPIYAIVLVLAAIAAGAYHIALRLLAHWQEEEQSRRPTADHLLELNGLKKRLKDVEDRIRTEGSFQAIRPRNK